MGSVKDIRSKAELDEVLGGSRPVVAVYFWAEGCEASKQMDQVVSHLATDFPHVLFLRVEAEKQYKISEAYAISVVPYFLFFKDGEIMETLEGSNPASLANKISKLAGSTDPTGPAAPASLGLTAGPTILESVQEISKEHFSNSSSDLKNPICDANLTNNLQTSHLKALVTSEPIMVFLEGKDDQGIVEIFRGVRVKCEIFDVLLDEQVREGLKVMSNWSSYPQIYVKGEFIGGADIVLEMHKSGELKRVLCDKGITASKQEP